MENKGERRRLDRIPSRTGIEVKISRELLYLKKRKKSLTARHKASVSTFLSPLFFFPRYFNYPFNKMQIATSFCPLLLSYPLYFHLLPFFHLYDILFFLCTFPFLYLSFISTSSTLSLRRLASTNFNSFPVYLVAPLSSDVTKQKFNVDKATLKTAILHFFCFVYYEL